MAGRLATFALACVGLLLGSCATTTPSLPPATAVPTPTPRATPVELQIVDGKLPPGRYVFSGFDQPITFTLDGSWTTTTQEPDYFNLMPDPGPGLIQVGLVQSVRTSADAVEAPATAHAAVAELSAPEGTSLTGPVNVTIGGLIGSQVTIERPGDSGGVLSYNVWVVVSMPPGGIGLEPGDRLSFSFFDTRDGVIAIVTHGTIDTWDAVVARAQPVLASFSFEP